MQSSSSAPQLRVFSKSYVPRYGDTDSLGLQGYVNINKAVNMVELWFGIEDCFGNKTGHEMDTN